MVVSLHNQKINQDVQQREAKKDKMKNMTPYESWEQEQVFRWKRANQIKHPELQLMYASLNGVRLSPGLRKKMKAQGLEPGFPDINLDVARNGYHGLRIELKRVKGGVVSKDQKIIIASLNEQNYLTVVCAGHAEAIKQIKLYLGI